MPRRKTLCQQHTRGESASNSGLGAGGYLAAPKCDDLPGELRRDDHVIIRGYTVSFGQWFFFPAIEPAVAFGRAARMSTECRGYGVYEAAREILYCDFHDLDEIVLLVCIASGQVGRSDDELQLELLKRFVQGVKEHPWSSHWHPPTGYISDYNDGRPVQTGRPSVPL